MKKILAAMFVITLGVAFAAPLFIDNDCSFANGGEYDDELLKSDDDSSTMDNDIPPFIMNDLPYMGEEVARHKHEAAKKPIISPRQASKIDIGTCRMTDEPDNHILSPRRAYAAKRMAAVNDEESEPQQFIESGEDPFVEYFTPSSLKDEDEPVDLEQLYGRPISPEWTTEFEDECLDN